MKTMMALLLVAGTATMATAQTASFRPLNAPGYDARVAPVYSGISGPYSGFAPGTNLGFDDYVSTDPSPFYTLAQFRFVGGVSTVGDTLRVNFYDSGANLFNFFNVSLGTAGNFVWTITLGLQPNGSDSTFLVPQAGFVEITAVTGAGRWFLTPTAPSVGSNNLAVGGLPNQFNHAFELVAVPAPGAMAFLGLGGLLASRRRR